MDAFQTRFAQQFSAEIETKIAELTRLLVTTPATDHSAYMERVGHLRGLAWALATAREVEAVLSKPEHKAAPSEAKARQTYES